MLTIYHGGCPVEQSKITDCLTSVKHSKLTLSASVVSSSWKSSKAENISPKIGRFRQTIRTQDSDNEIEALDEEGDLDGPQKRFRERGKEKDYDRDPEFAEILGSCLDDPDKAQSKMEERLKRKRNKILQAKTGSASPMKVTFSKFDFSNSYIWFEFYNPPLEKDVSLLCDLSQSPYEKRPSYDAIQGANVDPTTFYNIGDLEIQDNLARIWVDIGTRESLLLDVLLNALTQISSDFVGIKQVVFGGSEFESWKENLTVEDPGYSVHKI
ncbi:60 kDa chaperonin 2 [Bienertia sinuspersici]